MKRSMLVLYARFYTWLLRFYPRGFHKEFDREIYDVSVEVVQQADAQGTRRLFVAGFREIAGFCGSLIRENWHELWETKENHVGQSNSTDSRANGAISDGSSSRKSALLGALPFMLWGITLITLELPHEWPIPGWIQAGLFVLFFAILLVLPIGLGVAWTQGFPRWSYPYLTMTALFSLFLVNASTPGMRLFGYPTFGRELWGWRAWIPLLVVAAAALLISRSLRPVSMLFKNARNDWTLLTFSLFGLTPLLIAIYFDEMDRLFSLFFMVAFTLVAVATTLIYLRSGQSGKRSLALVVGIVSTIAIIVIGPNVYWQSHGGMNPIPSIVFGIVLALVMILPSLINYLKNPDRTLAA